jgi:hypothetical protein
VSGWDAQKIHKVNRQHREEGRSMVCPTGKRTWSSRSRAKRALKRIAAQRHTSGIHTHLERDVYKCRFCPGWHLTSQPQRTSRAA